MKIDFSYTFTDILTGEPIAESPGKDKPEITMTLAIIGVRALMQIDDPRGEHTSGEQKVKDFQLAQRIVKGGEIEITAEEATRLKHRIAKFFGPIIVGQAWPLLDGNKE
jgi:hypothetical protein